MKPFTFFRKPLIALFPAVLVMGCASTKAPVSFPGLAPTTNPASMATLRESNDTFICGFDTHVIPAPRHGGFHMTPSLPPDYRQFQVPAGHHSITIRLLESSGSSFKTPLHSTDRVIHVDLVAGHTYYFEPHPQAWVKLNSLRDEDWRPELLDEATKVNVITPSSYPATRP